MQRRVSFFLNGKAVYIDNPSPDLLLIDYLRSPEVGLAGPKKACGQGGCGACTVILSNWNEAQKEAEHRAINSCLRPVCALGGLVVTTIEGTGAARQPNPEFLQHTLIATRSAPPPDAPTPPQVVEAQKEVGEKRAQVLKAVQSALSDRAPAKAPLAVIGKAIASHPSREEHAGMNPVAHRLALNNGSQCGYCSVGFVMNMSEFIFNHPKATKREIEDIFDGNICRCTGYRPILTGMKTFASDWTAADEANRMKCLGDDGSASQLPAPVVIPFPPAARGPAQPVQFESAHRVWETPESLAALAEIMRRSGGQRPLRIIHGNTSFGIYKEEYLESNLFVDVRLIPELHRPARVAHGSLFVSAGTSYSDLIDVLEAEMKSRPGSESGNLGALHFMAQRTAGRIVRNAASLGGNTMLVGKHIAAGTGKPFPSDLCTAMVAVGADIEYLDIGDKVSDGAAPTRSRPLTELFAAVVKEPALADRIILIGYHLPIGSAADVSLAQKVALRDVNAHSIVNVTTRITLAKDLHVSEAVLCFGGIAPFPWRAPETERALVEAGVLSLQSLPRLVAILEDEVHRELAAWAARMEPVPDDGFTNEYRVELAVSFLYKAVVNALVDKGGPVPDKVKSSGLVTWGKWPISDGHQDWEKQDWKKPVAQPYIKLTAMYQCSGQLHYTQELAVPPLTVNAAFVVSRRALASYHFVIPGEKRPASDGALRDHLSGYAGSFVDLITHTSIKDGGLNYQGMGSDQPLFAEEMINFTGQAIALVIATTEQEAIRIADYVTRNCVAYTPVKWPGKWGPAWYEPITTLEQAIRMGSVFPDSSVKAVWNTHAWKVTRPGSRFDWTTENKDPLDRNIVNRTGAVDGLSCQIVESTQQNGGQAHFYMETQACIAEPADGRRLIVHSSTQSPMAMHQTTAMALAVEYHRIDVQIAPVGGGFGGKTEQARFVTGPVAVAAYVLKRPVRLAMPRDEDTGMIGKRHAYYGQYQIAVDRGELRPADRGLIRGFQTRMWGDGGAFYDCSFIVSNCIQLRADNAYQVANFENQIDVCRTNTAPSTAFRSFGDVQGKNILENAIDDAAFSIGMLPEDLREKNLYQRGQVTPFGQALSDCYMREVWAYLKTTCDYAEKRRSVDEYNRNNKWRKRGLGMIPVKYGSGYNLVQLEQAAAFINVNQADGSVIVHQGGVEMGQGLATQVEQVASYVLNVPMSLIHMENLRTSTLPNATSTGGSTGTPYNAEVVKQTCEILRARLTEFGYQMLKQHGNDWCHAKNIDFWNYGEVGWATQLTTNDEKKTPFLIWQKLVQLAYSQRVSLLASFTAKIKGGTTPVPHLTYKPQDLQPNIPGIERANVPITGAVDSFCGFTYSAACSVVEIDVLTGETKILSSDIVYDMGFSLNPAIDIGQVEGAFIQGVGYLLTEKLVFEERGPDRGRLNTVNTWDYKPPATTTIPLSLNVHLFPRGSVPFIPENPNDVFSAKEVGEPPLVLANSVFFAIKDAVRASRLERDLNGLFRMDAPATVQEVRRAVEVSTKDLV